MRLVAGYVDVDDVDRFVSWLGDVGDVHHCAVQAFDARYVAGEAHLRAAVERANRAFERGEHIARDRSVEILLYAAGRRQIDQAVEMGVDAGADVPVIIVVDGDPVFDGDEAEAVTELETKVERDDSVLGGGRDEALIGAFFDISDIEREAAATDLVGLVRERVALLDVEK